MANDKHIYSQKFGICGKKIYSCRRFFSHFVLSRHSDSILVTVVLDVSWLIENHKEAIFKMYNICRFLMENNAHHHDPQSSSSLAQSSKPPSRISWNATAAMGTSPLTSFFNSHPSS